MTTIDERNDDVELFVGPSGSTPNLGLPYPTPDDTVDVPRDVQALAEKLDPLGYAPVGAMMMWPTAIAPTGWLLMDGTPRAAASYPVLAALLGTTGGFVNVQDMRNYFPVGPGDVALGATAGAKTVALTAAESGMPAHNTNGASISHQHAFLTAANGAHSHAPDTAGYNFVVSTVAIMADIAVNSVASALYALRSAATNTAGINGRTDTTAPHQHSGVTDPGDAVHGHAVAAANAAAAHENRPPCRAVNFIIRAG